MIRNNFDIKNLEQPAILEKKDGTRIDIKAEIQSGKAFMTNINIPIEINDILERERCFVKDRYIVTDILPWNETLNSFDIEPHIEVTIIPESKLHKEQIQQFHISDISANRVYINSNDNSSNINIINSENNTKFEELKRIVAQCSNNNEELMFLVDEMKNTVGTKSFSQKYQDFMCSLANHVTVLQGVAPMMPWLSQFI